MTGGERAGTAGVITVVAAVTAIGVGVATNSAKKTAVREVQVAASRQLVPNCYRSQLQRGYLKIRAKTVASTPGDRIRRHAAALFRIADCDRSYAPGYQGPPVFLSASDEACFLKLEAEGFFDHRPPFTTPYLLRRQCAT